MLNVFEAFLISVTVIPVSVHHSFPLLMSPPDSSDVARKGIEPHITAGVSGHRGAACKKTCTDGQLVLPIHSFCTALTYKLYGLHPRWRCLRWQQELQQKYCFVLLAFTKAYRPLFVSHHFSPLSCGRSLCGYLVQGVLAALETFSPRLWLSFHACKAALAGLNSLTDQSSLKSAPVNDMLCRSCHHTLGLLIFSVSPNL